MDTSVKEPYLIEGGIAVDDRGQISFANGFDFAGVKRFYMIENFDTATVRAWHGHLKESKYVLVVQGSAVVGVVPMDSTTEPSRTATVKRFILSARKPGLLFIPAGCANGFRALEANTKIIFFSTTTLEESQGDDYRFPADYWGLSVWAVENR